MHRHIVFYLVRLALLPLLAFLHLSCGATDMVTNMPGQSHRGPLPALTAADAALAARLQQHVTAIASKEHNTAHPAQLEQAARYLETVLREQGYAVRRQEFRAGGIQVRNLEVTLPRIGTATDRRLVVVGAHYDSAPGAPGANDNASGTAAVLELARLLREAQPAARREIRLVLYVNEEPPYFKSEQMGSLVHARELHRQGAQVAAMLSLETLGYYADDKGSQHYPPPLDTLYPNTGNFIGFVGDPDVSDLVRRTIASFRRHAAFPSEGIAAPASLPGIDWSDHWAYRQLGYPALMITDTAPYRYPHYHTAQDTPDKLNYERLARVVQGVKMVIGELAE